MTPALLMRRLAAWRWVMAAAILVILVLALGQLLGFRWDPFDVAGRRMRAAQAGAAVARAAAAARRLEIEGRADQSRHLDDLHRQTVMLAGLNARAVAQARNAHDASISLDSDRADRLGAHDRELCRIAPDVCPAAPPASSVGGDTTLSTGSPSRGADDR